MPNRNSERGAMTPSVGARSGSSRTAPPTSSARTTSRRITRCRPGALRGQRRTGVTAGPGSRSMPPPRGRPRSRTGEWTAARRSRISRVQVRPDLGVVEGDGDRRFRPAPAAPGPGRGVRSAGGATCMPATRPPKNRAARRTTTNSRRDEEQIHGAGGPCRAGEDEQREIHRPLGGQQQPGHVPMARCRCSRG